MSKYGDDAIENIARLGTRYYHARGREIENWVIRTSNGCLIFQAWTVHSHGADQEVVYPEEVFAVTLRRWNQIHSAPQR